MNKRIKGEIVECRQNKKELEKQLKFSESIVTKDDLKRELDEFVHLDLDDQEHARRVFAKWIEEVVVKGNQVFIKQKFKI
jgi:hypothetical protein